MGEKEFKERKNPRIKTVPHPLLLISISPSHHKKKRVTVASTKNSRQLLLHLLPHHKSSSFTIFNNHGSPPWRSSPSSSLTHAHVHSLFIPSPHSRASISRSTPSITPSSIVLLPFFYRILFCLVASLNYLGKLCNFILIVSEWIFCA